MTATQNFRTATTGSTTAPSAPANGRIDTTTNQPRWVGPMIAAVVAVAAAAGILALRSHDDSTTSGTGAAAVAGVQPLIVAEEQAFIDARTTPLTHNAPTLATADPVWEQLADVNARYDTLGTSVDPAWKQLADLNASYDSVGGTVSATGAVEPLIVAEEQAFIDDKLAVLSASVADPVWEQLANVNARYDAVDGTVASPAFRDRDGARYR